MTIRLATTDDIPRIVPMVEALAASVNGPLEVDRGWTAGTLATLIRAPDSAVWVSGNGFLAAQLVCSSISPALIAREHGWWAGDGSGAGLLLAYRRWAREKGAALVQLSTGVEGPSLARLGFRAVEVAWVR